MTDVSAWAVAASPPALRAGEVHAWCVDLDAVDADGGAEAAGLSVDERTRAARFHFARDRARFLGGRAALRHLLAGYAGAEPHALVFAQGAHGKPALPGTGLEFNFSHSGGCAVLAVTRGRRVGVDVEQIRAERATLAMARRFFAPTEAAAVAAAARDEHAEPMRWSLRELVPAPHHLGALVVEGRGWTLRAWTWKQSASHLTRPPAARYP